MNGPASPHRSEQAGPSFFLCFFGGAVPASRASQVMLHVGGIAYCGGDGMVRTQKMSGQRPEILCPLAKKEERAASRDDPPS